MTKEPLFQEQVWWNRKIVFVFHHFSFEKNKMFRLTRKLFLTTKLFKKVLVQKRTLNLSIHLLKLWMRVVPENRKVMFELDSLFCFLFLRWLNPHDLLPTSHHISYLCIIWGQRLQGSFESRPPLLITALTRKPALQNYTSATKIKLRKKNKNF